MKMSASEIIDIRSRHLQVQLMLNWIMHERTLTTFETLIFLFILLLKKINKKKKIFLFILVFKMLKT